MSAPRLTVRIRRGIALLLELAEADIDADRSEETSRFNKSQNDDVDRALEYLRCLSVDEKETA